MLRVLWAVCEGLGFDGGGRGRLSRLRSVPGNAVKRSGFRQDVRVSLFIWGVASIRPLSSSANDQVNAVNAMIAEILGFRTPIVMLV